MTINRYKYEYLIRISVLSHPDELVGQLIRQLVQKHHGQTTNHTFESISISISTLRVFTEDCWVKLIIIQSIGRGFFDKMVQHYFRSRGAIILLSKDSADSFESARAFYHYFRLINRDPSIPVAFVEIQKKSNDILLEEVIQLKQELPDFYYGIRFDDFKAFEKILLSLVNYNLSSRKTNVSRI